MWSPLSPLTQDARHAVDGAVDARDHMEACEPKDSRQNIFSCKNSVRPRGTPTLQENDGAQASPMGRVGGHATGSVYWYLFEFTIG